jgi:tetratricopeptide (TPR) repeat protein
MIVLGAESLSLSQAPSNVMSSADATTTPTLENLLHETTAELREFMSSPTSITLLALIRSPIELQDAIMQLQNRSLIKHLRGADTSILRIHDLTGIMVQDRLKGDDEQEWFELAVALVCGAFFRCVEDPQSPKCWSHCEMFIPHFQLLTRRDMTHGSQNMTLTGANTAIVLYLRSCGRYNDAKTLCEQVLAVNRKQLGAEHSNTLTTMLHLAYIFESQGRYSDAEALCGHVLGVREKTVGMEHPETLDVMHLLAYVYRSQGRYGDAETLYKRVLAVDEMNLGKEHSDTLATMHNIASVYESLGRCSDAETLYKRVLMVAEKILGEDHPDTLITMRHIADVYESQGRHSAAKALYKQVLVVQGKILGEEHPDTLITKHNIAYVYDSQGRHSDAEAIYKQVLVGQEKLLGKTHPDTLLTIQNLANLYESLECHAGRVLVVEEDRTGPRVQTHSSQNINPVSQLGNSIGGMSFSKLINIVLNLHYSSRYSSSNRGHKPSNPQPCLDASCFALSHTSSRCPFSRSSSLIISIAYAVDRQARSWHHWRRRHWQYKIFCAFHLEL